MPGVYIKIASINTWKGDGNYFKRMQVMRDQLSDLKADVILCQECFASTDHTIDTLRFLAAELSMNYIFTSARRKTRLFGNVPIESFSGLGILSRFPITLLKELNLPTVQEDGERKAQIAAVKIAEDKKLIVVNLHLTHLQNAVEMRSEQIKSIAEAIKLSDQKMIRILGGDFNAETHSTEINLLHAILNTKDCYAMGHGKMPRISNDFQVRTAVDHLFILPDDKNNFPDFIDSKIALNMPDAGGLYASDHPAITTTLVL